MIGSNAPVPSRSLSRQVKAVEKQIMRRRQRVRGAVAGIKRKISGRMVSPGMLLTAAGIGVVMEQTSRHRGWSLATVLDAANASIRLLLSFSSPVHSVSENTTKETTHDGKRH